MRTRRPFKFKLLDTSMVRETVRKDGKSPSSRKETAKEPRIQAGTVLLCKKNEVGVDKVPTASEVEAVEAKSKSSRDADDKNTLALRDSNKLAYRDTITYYLLTLLTTRL